MLPYAIRRVRRVTTLATVAAMVLSWATLVSQAAAIVAYHVPAGVVGAPGGAQYYCVGMEFDVVEPVTVTALGAFDSGSDGVFGDGTVPVRVAIFDRLTQQPVTPVVSFGTADPGAALDGSRFKDLATPITLSAGFQGVIAADGYNGSRAEKLGNIYNQPQQWSFAGAPELSGTTVARALSSGTLGPSAQLQFPTATVNTSTTAAFAAGTFQFVAVPEASTIGRFTALSLLAIGFGRWFGSRGRAGYLAVVVVGVTGLGSPVSKAQEIVNGDFELPGWVNRDYLSRGATGSTGDDNFVYLGTTMDRPNQTLRGYNVSWVELPGGSTYLEGWKVGGAGVYHHLDNRPWFTIASSGDHCVQMHHYITASDIRGGSLEQEIKGLMPGTNYFLSFDLKQGSLSRKSVVTVSLGASKTVEVTNSVPGVWQTHTIPFVSGEGAILLKFATPAQTEPLIFLDRIRLSTNTNGGGPGLPEVKGFRTEVYASGILGPAQIAFGADGTLYIGNGAEQGRLRCILPGGEIVSETGDSLVDPDSVAVDVSGQLLNPAGLLLTGGQVGAGTGTIWAVSPCNDPGGKTDTVFATSADVGNPGPLHWHPTAGLLFVRSTTGGGGAVMAISKGFGGVLSLKTLIQLGSDFDTSAWLAVRSDGTIVKASNNGRLFRFFNSTGGSIKEVDLSALELGQYPGMFFGNGEPGWGENLYAINNESGNLYRIDETNASGLLIGRGLTDVVDVEFGPDGMLYASQYESGRIIRFAGDRAPELEISVSEITLRFKSALGIKYTVEFYTPEADAWTSLTSVPILGTGEVISVKDGVDASQRHRRYRLVTK